jgi:hypothetical protein
MLLVSILIEQSRHLREKIQGFYAKNANTPSVAMLNDCRYLKLEDYENCVRQTARWRKALILGAFADIYDSIFVLTV